MKKCTICHTGMYTAYNGIIKDHKVYYMDAYGNISFPKDTDYAIEECERGWIQFEVEGKWGFADIYTGEIVLEPIWDFAGPFYEGYARVSLGCQIEFIDTWVRVTGGKNGYINKKGEIIIPLEYEDAEDIIMRSKYFKVCKNEKWGYIDINNEIVIPLQWDDLDTNLGDDLIICGKNEECELYIGQDDWLLTAIFGIELEATCREIMKWGAYDQEFNLVVQAELDERPTKPKIKADPITRRPRNNDKYYILRKGRRYGIISEDGKWIANIELFKKYALEMINSFYE